MTVCVCSEPRGIAQAEEMVSAGKEHGDSHGILVNSWGLNI